MHTDHPDIVARVFWLKFKSLMSDIVDRQIFGAVQAFVWRIEWQARGLPHVHLLVILVEAIRTPKQVDAIVRAEIPDPMLHAELYSLVNEFQIHSPCDNDTGATCRDNSKHKCKRHFPKDMARETVIMGNKYPKYRRRGQFNCNVKGRIVSDNWVVPYSPFLTLKYRAHVNVEISSSIKSFKYVYKYVLKPPDKAVISINEVDAHLSGRILSAAEAVWRLLGLPLHKEFPAVTRLHIHLPNEHNVIFDPTAEEDVQEAATSSTSTIIQWFELNQRDASARKYLYHEIPEHYVWMNEMWVRRKRGIALGRMFAVSSRNQELFALKRLLTVVRGAKSWEDLLHVDGRIHVSFQEACGARGMLADDSDIVEAFQEIASVCCSRSRIRREFALLLLSRHCQNAQLFFTVIAEHLCDDGIVNPANCAIALWAIEDIMASHGRSLCDRDFGFELPVRPSNASSASSSCFLKHMFNREDCEKHRDELTPLFTDEQREAMHTVVQAVNGQSRTNVFAILASAGCGKTVWVSGLTWLFRAQGHIVMNIAASALAATLLPGGSTAHSAFRIPIPTTSVSYCGVKNAERELIRQCKCLFYDEVSMVGKEVAACLDRFLRDIMGSSLPFGGKIVVFLGDFKQLLPVEPGQRYPATVKDCDWWNCCQVMRFTKNWRAVRNPDYCAFLEDVGNGRLLQVPVPDHARASDYNDIISKVYGQDLTSIVNSRNMIMAYTLQTCLAINTLCLDAISSSELSVNAFDDTRDNRQPDLYTPEYLAALVLHGVPPSVLPLKVSARYMIIKNYNPDKGVCNGAMCELLTASRNVVQVKLLNGIDAGRIIVLPRCSCHVSRENSGLPFDFTRVQFPLIPGYCVSVHKSQGQNLDRIGLIIDQDAFAHGQVYTALSRTSGWPHIHVLMPNNDSLITNVVYKHYL